MSRLLVGSSSISSCGAGAASIVAARAARKRSPPERVPAGCSARAPLNRNRASWARMWLSVTPGASRATFAATLSSSSSTSRRCGRNRSGTNVRGLAGQRCEFSRSGCAAAWSCRLRCGRRARCVRARAHGGLPSRSAPNGRRSSRRLRTVRPAGTAVCGRLTRISASSRIALRGLLAPLARLVQPVLLEAAELVRRLLRGPLAFAGDDSRGAPLGVHLLAVPLAAGQLDLGLLQFALLPAHVRLGGPQHPPGRLLLGRHGLLVRGPAASVPASREPDRRSAMRSTRSSRSRSWLTTTSTPERQESTAS